MFECLNYSLQCVLRYGVFRRCVDFVAGTLLCRRFRGRLCGQEKRYLLRGHRCAYRNLYAEHVSSSLDLCSAIVECI